MDPTSKILVAALVTIALYLAISMASRTLRFCREAFGTERGNLAALGVLAAFVAVWAWAIIAVVSP